MIDAIVEPEDLRDELIRRLGLAGGHRPPRPAKRHGIPPV